MFTPMIKKNKQHIKAFTLMEMMVVMVLMGVTSSLGYIVYVKFIQYQLEYTSSSDTKNDQLLFLEQMRYDIKKYSHLVTKEDNNSIHIGSENMNQNIVYEFHPLFTIRTQANRIDTLFVSTNELHLHQVDAKHTIIDRVDWTFTLKNEPIHYLVAKTYSQQQLFETSLLAQ